jgi:hypothetical protein
MTEDGYRTSMQNQVNFTICCGDEIDRNREREREREVERERERKREREG